jgi:hypothetical protein
MIQKRDWMTRFKDNLRVRMFSTTARNLGRKVTSALERVRYITLRYFLKMMRMRRQDMRNE